MMSNSDMMNNTSKQRSFTGRVTKFLNTFGFVDDDVFFQMSVVKGNNVQVGDEVYVECQYSEQLPFKWNATKIEPIRQQSNVASTYLQHRLMLQQKQHESQSQSYYVPEMNSNQPIYAPDYKQGSNSSLSHPHPQAPDPRNAPISQQPTPYSDYSATQDYYSRQPDYNNAQYQQLTYTSTPGAAFVSTQILPYSQQPASGKIPKAAQAPARPANYDGGFNKNSSRWDENRIPARTADRSRRETRNRFDERERARERERERPRDRMDWNPERRDKSPDRDRSRFDYERDKHSTRDKERGESLKRRSTESPMSTSGKARRRYDADNVPKYSVLKPVLTTYDIRQRYGANIHIPSDFKEVRVNCSMDLNISSIPKPIMYHIERPVKTEDKKDDEQKIDEKILDEEKKELNKIDKKLQVDKVDEQEKVEDSEKVETSEILEKVESTDKVEQIEEEKEIGDKIDEQNDKKDDSKSEECILKEPKLIICNKYGVKVVLLSLPSMSEIYEKVFGPDDGYGSSKPYFVHFNKVLSFLCLKNHNEGHTLIGGKFDASQDGYLVDNEKPNLIATAVRCVKQQTGIDLSGCRRWKQIITFVYNRDDSISSDSPLEFSYIFLPDVWSLLGDEFYKFGSVSKVSREETQSDLLDILADSNLKEVKTESVSEELPKIEAENVSIINEDGTKERQVSANEESSQTSTEEKIEGDLDSNDESKKSTDLFIKKSDIIPLIGDEEDNQMEPTNISERQILLDRINELKVVDLRSHLESRGVKVKSSLKKSELVEKLREVLLQEFENDEEQSDSVKENWWTQMILNKGKKDEGDHPENESDKIKTEEMQPATSSIEKSVVNEMIKNNERESVKRKMESEEDVNTKKIKIERSPSQTNGTSKINYGECCIETVGENLDMITLTQALHHHRYDHFELAVTAELLREEITRHFSHYIISTLVANKPKKDEPKTESNHIKGSIKNDYVLLAFSYFDSNHCGYILVEDLLRLMHTTNISISRKTWHPLLRNEEKVYYKSFKEPEKLIDLVKSDNIENAVTDNQSTPLNPSEKQCRLFEKDGNIYDIYQLIEQGEQDDKIKSELKDTVRCLQEKIDKQREHIKELEGKQSRIDVAIEKQNDEICALKREKESLKSKYKESFEAIESCVSTFNAIIRKHKEEKK